MKEPIHLRLMKFFGQLFFLFQSFLFIMATSIYRFGKRILHKHPTHYNPFKATHEDVFKSRKDIMKLDGFKTQEYEFLTEDKAHVSFWRIVPDTLNEEKLRPRGTPIIIQHGLLDCAMSWFLQQKAQDCLPYILALEGYDVWVGNNRGTKYSYKKNHHQEYWNYDIDHLVQYDIPCMINEILKETNYQKLIYIGHSQGTTQLLTALDVHRELQDKIECFIGLGPVISVSHLKHNLIEIVERLKVCQILKLIGFKAMFIIPDWMSMLIGILIYNSYVYYKLFLGIVVGLCGQNQKGHKISPQRFGAIISQQPGGSSVNNVHHWLQLYRNKRMAKFDHGKKKNMQIYGSEQPPEYTYQSLKNLPFHCYLFRGSSDKVISDQDFQNLKNKFHPEKHTVYHLHDYAHLDYIWSEHAPNDIYHHLRNILQRQSQDCRKRESTENSFE